MEISSLFKKSRFFFWKYQNALNFWYKKLIFQYQEFKLFDFKNSLFDIRKCLKNVSASYKIYKRIAKGRLVFKFFEEIMYDLSNVRLIKHRQTEETEVMLNLLSVVLCVSGVFSISEPGIWKVNYDRVRIPLPR